MQPTDSPGRAWGTPRYFKSLGRAVAERGLPKGWGTAGEGPGRPLAMYLQCGALCSWLLEGDVIFQTRAERKHRERGRSECNHEGWVAGQRHSPWGNSRGLG